MTNLPALREAVAKMTGGPWECVATGFHGDELHIGPPDKPAVVRNIPRADAAGIVALRNAAPALLDELEQLREHRRLLILWAEGCAARLPVAERKALNWRDVDVARKAARQAWQAAKETP